MKAKASLSQWILQQPVVWGALGCLSFYAVAGGSTLNHPMVVRYFESHPVEYITTLLFFVGLAALVLKAIDLVVQHAALSRPLLEQLPEGGQPTAESAKLLEQLAREPAGLQNSYLVRRLRDALLYVRRKGSADALDSQLQYLADYDVGRMHASYAVVRLVIWAIPILGFLGTVIGITLAIGRLSPEQLQESMDSAIGGLSVAFDTTALALALSIVLMFAKYLVERMETRLLARVDERTSSELVGRFHQYGTSTDPYAASVRRLGEAIEASTEQLTRKQAEVWKETIDAAHQQWAQLNTAAGELLEAAIANSLTAGLKQHAESLDQGLAKHAAYLSKEVGEIAVSLRAVTKEYREAVTTSTDRHGDALREALVDHTTTLSETARHYADTITEAIGKHTGTLSDLADGTQSAFMSLAGNVERQQSELTRQGEILLKVVDATGQVRALESTLNENLAALAGSGRFEETANSLAAAVQLLAARLGHAPTAEPHTSVQLADDSKQDKPEQAAA